MKKRTMIAATLVVLALSLQAQVIGSYQVRDAVTLRGPIETDSINSEGRKFEAKNLLAQLSASTRTTITRRRWRQTLQDSSP